METKLKKKVDRLFKEQNVFQDAGICITGTRDKMMCVWNLDHKKNALVLSNDNAHNGRIWDILLYQQDQFFSCVWDGQITGWSLFNGHCCFKEFKYV